jgi:hypothetical protein
MPDLTDELRRVAADAASGAVPEAITEVIRRGDRRRRRAIAQRSAGGLSALGFSAVLLITGIAHHAATPTSPTAAAAGVTTLTETTSSAAGTLTIQVRYRSVPSGWARLLSVTYSGSAHASVPRPALVLTLRPLRSGRGGAGPVNLGGSVAIKLTRSELGHFAGSVPLPLLRQLDKGKPVSGTFVAVLGGPLGTANYVKSTTTKHVSPPPFRELAGEGLIVG